MEAYDKEKAEVFFNWFRRRVANVRRLDHEPDLRDMFAPEQHVLVATALDALAKYWAETFSVQLAKRKDAKRRMGEFLHACGGSDIFSRCSHGDLLRRARPDHHYLEALSTVLAEDPKCWQLRHWQDDPEFQTLKSNVDLKAAGLTEEWLRESRFGEVIYRDLRSAWVHELQAASHLSSGTWKPERTEPWYDNRYEQRTESDDYYHERRLVLPLAFLITTLERAVQNFEEACAVADVIPAVLRS